MDYIEDQTRSILVSLATEVARGGSELGSLVAPCVEEALEQISISARRPLDEVRSDYFQFYHAGYQETPRSSDHPIWTKRHIYEAVEAIVNSEARVVGSAPSWKPTITSLRGGLAKAIVNSDLILSRAERVSSQFEVVVQPPLELDCDLELQSYTAIRPYTEISASIRLPKGINCFDLYNLFGDCRSKVLFDARDVDKWMANMIRYSQAVFYWWGRLAADAEVGS